MLFLEAQLIYSATKIDLVQKALLKVPVLDYFASYLLEKSALYRPVHNLVFSLCQRGMELDPALKQTSIFFRAGYFTDTC